MRVSPVFHNFYLKNNQSNKHIQNDPKLQEEILKLQEIDTHVKNHEAAHKAAGGEFAGSASYSYTIGPDGKKYAVAGEVPIAIKKGKTPEETMANMEKVKAAALAPADPSPQDLKVAATASTIENQAKMESKKLDKGGLLNIQA